jgi:NAD(P)-dependent dehydrogenase (short-subunit alcohol dehydrogenase family)
LELHGRTALVTGASSGIGREVARILVRRGARVALFARRAPRLRALAEELGAASALAVPGDVTDPEAVRAAVAETVARFGRLDCLVNCAGIAYFGELAAMSPDDFDRVVRTNVYGVLHTVRAAVPHLRHTRGMIVNVSSGLSKRALPFLTAYAGTKSMLDGLSDGMRLELRRHGIRVLNYCAPETETELDAQALHAPGTTLPGGRRRRRPAPAVAGRIVRAMERERREVVEDPLFAVMAFLAPGLLDNIFYRVMVQRFARDDPPAPTP